MILSLLGSFAIGFGIGCVVYFAYMVIKQMVINEIKDIKGQLKEDTTNTTKDNEIKIKEAV